MFIALVKFHFMNSRGYFTMHDCKKISSTRHRKYHLNFLDTILAELKVLNYGMQLVHIRIYQYYVSLDLYPGAIDTVKFYNYSAYVMIMQ